jgi:hypothetical protein
MDRCAPTRTSLEFVEHLRRGADRIVDDLLHISALIAPISMPCRVRDRGLEGGARAEPAD